MAPMETMYGQSGLVIRLDDSAYKGPFDDTIQEIEHEASVYERLGRHPRIAEYRGRSWERIVLKFYNNRTMSHKVSDENFTIPSMLWANQILEALIFMHDRRVLHCDLRGANIFVTDELDIVLADFGSAAVEGKKATGSYYDAPHCVPGFLDRDHELSAKDDLFAFGTVLYHLSTRKLPFEDRSESELIRSYLDGVFPDVSELEVGHIIQKCWHKAYQSPKEVQDDLSAYDPKYVPGPVELTVLLGKLRSSDLKISPRLRWLPPLAFGCCVLFPLVTRYIRSNH